MRVILFCVAMTRKLRPSSLVPRESAPASSKRIATSSLELFRVLPVHGPDSEIFDLVSATSLPGS